MDSQCEPIAQVANNTNDEIEVAIARKSLLYADYQGLFDYLL